MSLGQSILLFLLALTLVGCGKPPKPGPPAASEDAAAVTVVDTLNRQVTLKHRAQRVVSLAPKNTEELFAIGAGDCVVGVTSYCNYPPEARQREQIGGFSSKSISLE